MSSSANVQAISALEDLRSALGRFRGEAQEALQAAEHEIRRTLEWLAERERHWKTEVRRRQEELASAQAALDRCLALASSDDHPGDAVCTPYEIAVVRAQARLRKAQAGLRNVQRWKGRVENAVSSYHLQARRLSRLANSEVPRANAFLGRKIMELERYRAVSIKGGSGSSSGSKGAAGEEWARKYVFGGAKTRITVRPEDNPHLALQDDAGLQKPRESDHYIDSDGGLWDVKTYSANSTISREQVREYNLMADAGHVVDTQGIRRDIKSINYLFLDRSAAMTNYEFLNGESVFVWYADEAGTLKCLQQELGDVQ